MNGWEVHNMAHFTEFPKNKILVCKKSYKRSHLIHKGFLLKNAPKKAPVDILFLSTNSKFASSVFEEGRRYFSLLFPEYCPQKIPSVETTQPHLQSHKWQNLILYFSTSLPPNRKLSSHPKAYVCLSFSKKQHLAQDSKMIWDSPTRCTS